jgi:hypothetical protein
MGLWPLLLAAESSATGSSTLPFVVRGLLHGHYGAQSHSHCAELSGFQAPALFLGVKVGGPRQNLLILPAGCREKVPSSTQRARPPQSSTVTTPWSWISCLQSCEQSISVDFALRVYGIFVRAAQKKLTCNSEYWKCVNYHTLEPWYLWLVGLKNMHYEKMTCYFKK